MRLATSSAAHVHRRCTTFIVGCSLLRADTSTMKRDASKLLDELRELQPIPLVAARVMTLVQDPSTEVRDLAEVVSTDPSLSARMIRLSNSAEYAFGRRCASARDAIQLLGFLQVRQIAVTASFMSMFAEADRTDTIFDTDLFWAHSLTVAVAAEMMATETGAARPDDAFTAGVLHDIGRLVLRQALPDEFRRAGELARAEGIPLHEAELRTTGHRHEEIGEALARRWLFPDHLAKAIAAHHEDPVPPASSGLPWIIARANSLVLAQGITCGFHAETGQCEAAEVSDALQCFPDGMTPVLSRAAWFMDQSLGRRTEAA